MRKAIVEATKTVVGTHVITVAMTETSKKWNLMDDG